MSIGCGARGRTEGSRARAGRGGDIAYNDPMDEYSHCKTHPASGIPIDVRVRGEYSFRDVLLPYSSGRTRAIPGMLLSIDY